MWRPSPRRERAAEAMAVDHAAHLHHPAWSSRPPFFEGRMKVLAPDSLRGQHKAQRKSCNAARLARPISDFTSSIRSTCLIGHNDSQEDSQKHRVGSRSKK
jgi:hypothetical protein